MYVQNITVTKRRIPLLAPFKTALRTVTEIESVDVVIMLDTGVTGRGSAAPTYVITGESAESIEAALKGPIKDALIGISLLNFQEALGRIQAACIGNSSAKAAADIALYDAYSQELDVPLWGLLGGKKQMDTCMTISVDHPEKMALDSKQAADKTFEVLKVKVGNDPELDFKRIEAIRSVIPKETRLRLDANQGWNPKQAVSLIRRMEEMDWGIEFIEQPVKASDWDGLKFVTDRVQVPIMADESLFSARDAVHLTAGKYADMLNIKLMKCGGINEAWKIASLAEVNGIPCMIGSMMESSLSVSAAAHFAAAHPNVHYFDLDAPLWLDERPKGLRYEGRKVELFDSPGLGVQTVSLSQ
ncbi:dipeptide epimerase [Bacillus sp. FJAT-42376]|uniref:dipeptide epimerase n=1 Tax=Bacillus sp. FJAT-42376 TaxID=2014076 RepID=UPI000F502259|nr:dipeptide epimerase [Bacillus sp. FJAT-42376]AZB44485.1 dipeptide epimerase [Bacillus sp. FJAT-42376]